MPTEKQLADADRLLMEGDWSAIEAMTDQELRAAWDWDKDAVWPTSSDLLEFGLIVPIREKVPVAKDAAE